MGENKEFLSKVVRLFDDPDDKVLAEEVERSRKESLEDEKWYSDFVHLWEHSAQLKPLELIPTKDARRNLSARLGVRETAFFSPLFIRLTGVAASILIVLAGVLMFRNASGPLLITKKTLPGRIDSIILSDQSRIYLAGGTTVVYPERFEGNERLVVLHAGEAFFDIKRIPEKPFEITTGRSKVVVLGTSFSITRNKRTIEVSVKTGTVKFELTEGGREVILNRGTGIRYAVGSGKYNTYQNINQNSFSWITRELQFVDAPLKDVLASLEKYYKVKFIADSFTSSSKFNADFKDSDLDEVLTILKETYPIEIVRKDSLVFVRGK